MRPIELCWLAVVAATALTLAACDDGGGADPAADVGDGTANDGGPPPDAQPGCSVGTESCRCLMNGGCRVDGLECVEGICRDPSAACDPAVERCPPAEPKCYTPCRGSVTDESGFRACSGEGLLEGCLNGAVCDRGSCLPITPMNAVAGARGECEVESQCPDFQTCIRGRCYSECDTNTDCDRECDGADCSSQPVFDCHRHVCRQVCNERSPCPNSDAPCTDGLCIPQAPAGAPAARPDSVDFTVAPNTVSFTSAITTSTFTLLNGGATDLTFTITKLEQRTVDGDGDAQIVTQDPLLWLELDGERVGELVVTVPAGGASDIVISNAKTAEFSRWEGALQVVVDGGQSVRVRLNYSQEVQGRWVGTAYAFGNFPDGTNPETGVVALDAWRANRADTTLAGVPNAFMKAWARFRQGGLDTNDMAALIDATLTQSWDFPRVRQLCRALTGDAITVCAPSGGTGGGAVIPYTADGATHVPSGVVEMDFALHLQAGGPGCAGAGCFTGRIDSTTALQYGDNPAVRMQFAGDPTACAREGEAGCLAFIDSFESTIVVGGRGNTPDACPEGYDRTETPWLVPGIASPSGSADFHVQCQQSGQPLTGANPIPDAAPRRRTLELVDGIMLEQHVMMLILRETVDAFHGGRAGLSSYLYVVLQRSTEDPESLNTRGTPQAAVPGADWDLGLTCDADLVRTVTGRDSLAGLSAAQSNALTTAIISGGDGAAGPVPSTVYYICVSSEDSVQTEPQTVEVRPGVTQQIDVAYQVSSVRQVLSGPPDDRLDPEDQPDTPPCFPGAEIIYFTIEDENPWDWGCNDTAPAEDCLTTLVRKSAQGGRTIHTMSRSRDYFPAAPEDTHFDLIYTCTNPGQVSCDQNRFDLVGPKAFGLASNSQFFTPLGTEIAQAFRYKTQFVGRSGAQLGFAPSICQGGSNLIPYCYDPVGIAAVRRRVDCAMALYQGALAGDLPIGATERGALRLFLDQNFSALQRDVPGGDPILQYGFERLYAELLIMLGDDAYTASFASRFDLAGSAQLAFTGSDFEEGGIDLSGAAGYEMYKLYQAGQHYTLVLDRFYAMITPMWAALDNDATRFVTPATVTTYLDRVIRASTQSANVWSQVAQRYQSLNRPQLARRVLERAYTRAYQESLILGAFMQQIMTVVGPNEVDQVRAEVTKAARRYRVAMLDMRNRYLGIANRTDIFGLPPEFIPFPALNEDDVNGFEVMLDRANNRMELAAEDEVLALGSRRDFDTDQASFQSELVTIRQGYEASLGDICGTFIAADGRTYPAVPRYAHLDPDLAVLDDPCGAVGNGAFWLAGSDLQGLELALQRVRQEAMNNRAADADAQAFVVDQCALIDEDAQTFLDARNDTLGWERDNDRMGTAITQLDKVHDLVSEVTARVADASESSSKPWVAAAKLSQNVVYGVSAAVNLVATSALEIAVNVNQERIRETERDYEEYTIRRECAYLQAEQVYTLRDLHREMLLIELDILNAVWNVEVAFSDIQALANERNRLDAEWQDTEQLLINVAAARNDPNIRIYKNDAIISADRSFARAVREAWMATRNFEYYTASSYPEREKLFLVRMVNYGDVNLRRYLQDLEDDFHRFEQQFGNPDTRVATISLRDDVIRVPYLDTDGEALSTEERVNKFRQALQNPQNLSDSGALTFGFATSFDALSPLTVNHKILFIEVEFFGQNTGDAVGRVYLRQVGTGVLEGTDGRRQFFSFPPRTAVMNPFFNGDRAFGQDSDGAITGPTRSIYRSYRFRERPIVQSNWELVLDQRNEAVNQDIDLAGVDDVLVYVYYTDFTRD